MDDRMNIIFGSSKELALFSMVTIKSLFVNNPEEKFNIWFYYHEPMDDILKKITTLVTGAGSDFYPMFVSEERLKELSVGDMYWWHTAIWYRYYCVEDLYGKHDRALLLGTDVLVQKNIRDFYDTNLGDKCLYAVVDMGYFNKYPLDVHTEHGIRKYGYVNTDIMVIDIKKAYGRLGAKQLYQKYRDGGYWALDQDVINIDYRDCLLINEDMHFNYIPVEEAGIFGTDHLEKERDKATFIHLAVIKPWNEYAPEYAHDLWFEYAKTLPDQWNFLLEVIAHTGAYIKKYNEKKDEEYRKREKLYIDAMTEEIRKKNAHIYKMDKLYWICDKLLTACRDGVLGEKLRGLHAGSIAIYGCGKLGRQLLRYCRDSGIDISCFIDANAEGSIDGLGVLNVSSLKKEDRWDAIIVTPIYVFDEIADRLRSNGRKVISLEDIV